MSEKERFHKMTKPIKFRKLRVIFKSLDSIYRVYRHKLKYLINYILYKIKILKRYSYRDMAERVVSLPHNLEPQVIETDDYKALVNMQVIIRRYWDMDYFYRKTRKGTEVITMWVSEIDETKIHLRSHLEDIQIYVEENDSWYDVSELPRIKIVHTHLEPIVKLWEKEHNTKPQEVKTVEYDIRPLRKLIHDIDTNCSNILELTKPRLEGYYEFVCSEFVNELVSMPIDTIRWELN